MATKKLFAEKLYCTTVQQHVNRGMVAFSDVLPGSQKPGETPKQSTINFAMQVQNPKGKSEFQPGKQYTFTITED